MYAHVHLCMCVHTLTSVLYIQQYSVDVLYMEFHLLSKLAIYMYTFCDVAITQTINPHTCMHAMTKCINITRAE